MEEEREKKRKDIQRDTRYSLLYTVLYVCMMCTIVRLFMYHLSLHRERANAIRREAVTSLFTVHYSFNLFTADLPYYSVYRGLH
jgi:hypothetical protein